MKATIINNELLEKFTEYMTIKGYSKATIATNVRMIHYFATWAVDQNIPELEEVTYSDALGFIKWCSKNGVSQKTIALYLRHINHYYSFLKKENSITENPVAHIRIKGIKRKVMHDILTVDQLQELYKKYPTTIDVPEGKTMPPQEQNVLSRKRNKMIVSLLVHQGLRVEEIKALKVEDLNLREGKIYIASRRRTAARWMNLEAHQIYEFTDYLSDTRKQLLKRHGQPSEKCFINHHPAVNFYGITMMMLKHLRKINPLIKNLDQIRASVITNWIKIFDLRKVQYLAGHKYVSSTEAYKVNDIDDLKEDIKKYHPF